MSRRKKNAGHGYGMDFHGAFSSKADAKKKERKVHGFIRPTTIKGERRYVVMSERKNPRPRRNKARPEFVYAAADHTGRRFTDWSQVKDYAVRQAKTYGGQLLKMGVDSGKESVVRSYRVPGKRYGYSPGENPMDLVVMGANPGPGEKRDRQRNKVRAAEEKFFALAERERQARRSGDPNYESLKEESMRAFEEMELQRRIYGPMTGHNPQEITVHPGQTITLKVNPSAEVIREEFTGREYEYSFISDEPHMRAGDYAKLGDLMGISYKPVDGGQVRAVGWYEGAETIPLHEAAKSLRKLTDAPVLVSDETRRQLYFVAGNQDASPLGLRELGEARMIVYRERKHFDDFALINYQHNFGEENGKRPTLFYDAGKNRLLLEGGDYEVRPEGITN